MRVDDGKTLVSFWEVDMPDWGSIAEYPLPGLISRILWQKRTGVLKLINQQYKKELFFNNGVPVYARSNMVSEALGRFMVRQGFIKQADYEKSVELIAKTDKMQGAVLIEMGALAPSDLSKALAMQAQERIEAACTWRDGEFSFERMSTLPEDITPIKLNPIQIISKSIRSITTLERIKEEIHLIRSNIMRKANAKNLAKITNDQGEVAFYNKLPEGDIPVSGLIEKAKAVGMTEETVLRYIFFFLTHNLLKVTSAPKQPIRSTAPPAAAQPQPNGAQDQHEPIPESEKALRQQFLRMKAQNYFELFDTDREGSPAKIKKGYFMMAKQYHPDKHFDSKTGEMIQAADDIFTLINEAYQTLTDEKKRAAYIHFLDTGETEKDQTAKATRIITAEVHFSKGEAFLKKKAYDEALAEIKKAIDLNPEEGEYYGYRGWTNFKKFQNSDPEKVKSAVTEIKKAIEMSPKFADGYYFLGFIEKVSGDTDASEKHFRKALEINPNNVEASREIRLIEMRKAKK